MNSSSDIGQLNFRYFFVLAMFFCGILAIIWRLVDLTVFDNAFLLKQGNARSLRTSKIPAFRGMITDRHGSTLAVSTPVYAIWVNPHDFDLNDSKSLRLLKILQLEKELVQLQLISSEQKEFMYLQRGVSPHIAKEIEELKIKGCYLQQEFKRYYPEGEVTAHILGFNNIDDDGQEGIELLHNDWLKGIPGKRRVHKNRLGHVIQDLGVIKESKAGRDLKLSIDLRLQFIAHGALQEAIEKHKVVSGSVIIMDAKNGEILAMVNHPTFNPNKKVNEITGQFRNRAVTDLFEPGSVMKPFLVAAALDSGKFQHDTIIDTSPGWMVVGGKTIKDLAYYGKITIGDILKKSSNVGVVRMLAKLNPERYTDLLKKAGISELTYARFPGESSGVILEQKSFNHTLAVLSMGYSLSMTPLQLIRAFSIFTGDGKLKAPSLLKRERQPKMPQVITQENSQRLLTVLEEVTNKKGWGTARRGAVKGYRLAAKTGTARLLGENGYDKNRHVGSIVGLGPVSNPRLIVAVVLMDPKGKDYYGGVIAAPVFSKVMSESFRVLEIQKDQDNENAKN